MQVSNTGPSFGPHAMESRGGSLSSEFIVPRPLLHLQFLMNVVYYWQWSLKPTVRKPRGVYAKGKL